MPQVTLRLPEDLARRIDNLPGEGERSAKIRWLIEQGLQAADNQAKLDELYRMMEAVGREASAARKASEQVSKVLPRSDEGKPYLLAPYRPEPPQEFELEAKGWFGRLVGKAVAIKPTKKGK